MHIPTSFSQKTACYSNQEINMQTGFFSQFPSSEKQHTHSPGSSCSNPTIQVYSTYSRTANSGTKIQPENMSQLSPNCHATTPLFRLHPMAIEWPLDKSNHSRRRTLPWSADQPPFGHGLSLLECWKTSRN